MNFNSAHQLYTDLKINMEYFQATHMGHFQIGAHFLSGGLICDATCHIFEKITQHKFKGNVSRSF